MNSVKNVWTMLEHSGFEDENFSLDVNTANQEVLLSLISELEGSILVTLTISEAISLKNELTEAIACSFEEVRALEQEYEGGV